MALSNLTSSSFSSSSSYADSKPHYEILDGLRGVAAVIVVAYHLCEAHAIGVNQLVNHGYMAVDFFFLLSGFVIGYAYDDRWGKMSLNDFFKRRLIRLQPMVVMGSLIGAALYYLQASNLFPMIADLPVWKLLLVMLIGCTLLPVPLSMDIRGWGEMHPLNGPAWSLFFEYIANILYALFIRKFSKTVLSVFVFLAGCLLIRLALVSPRGDIVGGWSLDSIQLQIGFIRLLYPFFAGLLLFRIGKLIHVKHAFFWCSLFLATILIFPRLEGGEHLWINGLYDSLCIIFLFPLIVFLGASGEVKGKYSSRICKFLGDISYPLYITHYPLVYLYTAWVRDHEVSQRGAFPVALLVIFLAIAIAYACLKLYDEPVRAWLKELFLKKR